MQMFKLIIKYNHNQFILSYTHRQQHKHKENADFPFFFGKAIV